MSLDERTFTLLVVGVVVVLPFLIMGVVGLILSMRDRAYARGFEDAYSWARQVSGSGGRII